MSVSYQNTFSPINTSGISQMSNQMQTAHRPVFSSMARLQALARFVASSSSTLDSDKSTETAKVKQGESKKEIQRQLPPMISTHKGRRPPPRHTQVSHLPPQPQPQMMPQPQVPVSSAPKEPLAVTALRDLPKFHPSPDYTVTASAQQNQQGRPLGTNFSVRSGGFRYGNMSEIWFGNKLFLPRSLSRRGLCVLCLNYNHTSFHAWQFDFYPNAAAKKTNENLIQLIEKLPENVYFALAVKDDIFRNLHENTKQFLARTVGCQSIYNLRFRESWCAVIHKPTASTYEVLGEDHRPIGIARVDVRIPPLNQPMTSVVTQPIVEPRVTSLAPKPEPMDPLQMLAKTVRPPPAPARAPPTQPHPEDYVIPEPAIDPAPTHQATQFRPTGGRVMAQPINIPRRRRRYVPPAQHAPTRPSYRANQLNQVNSRVKIPQPDLEPEEQEDLEPEQSESEESEESDSPPESPRPYEPSSTMREIQKVRKRVREEESNLKASLESVHKELSGHLFLLKDLKKESESLKRQIRKQIDAIRSIRVLVTQNESALQDLNKTLIKTNRKVHHSTRKKSNNIDV
jgi:hypothetical protein